MLKNHLSGAVLHNCLKYAVESTRLRLEVEKQQYRYKTLFYNSVDPAFFLQPNWKIENVNAGFSSLFAVDFLGARGRSLRTFFHNSEDFEELRNSDALRERNQVDIELQFQKADGSKPFLGHLKISALREFDQKKECKVTVGYHGTLVNVSYRERLRKVKLRADKVNTTYRLARALAHEIRNPLTNVNLALEELRDEIPKDCSAEVYLDIVERSAKRIDKLIGQLLKSSSRKNITRKFCNLADLIKEILAEATDRGRLKKIEIRINVEKDLPEIACDLDKLKLAVSNLTTNAIEAVSENEGVVEIGAYREEGDICIYVKDNGAGMSPETVQQIYEPFFTRKDRGLGLGLTTTQTIIAEHEGEIEVESNLGTGSVFTICLPQSPESSRQNREYLAS